MLGAELRGTLGLKISGHLKAISLLIEKLILGSISGVIINKRGLNAAIITDKMIMIRRD